MERTFEDVRRKNGRTGVKEGETGDHKKRGGVEKISGHRRTRRQKFKHVWTI